MKTKPESLLDLYFYRVKVSRELEKNDLMYLNWHDYSWLELNIVLALKAGSATAPYLTEKIFGFKYTKSLQLKHRTSVIKALNRLLQIKMVRKYPVHRHDGIGRPSVRYALMSNIVTLEKKCSNCKNSNYLVIKHEGKVKCIYCGLEWIVPGVKK